MDILENQSNFDYIWNTWVEPLIVDLESQADPDFVKKTLLHRKSHEELFHVSEKFFKKRRRDLKCEYYGKNYKENSTEGLMDFHKLSSILCRTLIEYKVFSFNIDSGTEIAYTKESTDIDWFVRNTLINYRLAFLASVVFLYQSMIFLYSEENSIKESEEIKARNKILHAGLLKRKKLDLYSENYKYSGSKVHASFENSLVLGLSKRDIEGHSFDLLMYATLMYQLEEYNKVLIMHGLN